MFRTTISTARSSYSSVFKSSRSIHSTPVAFKTVPEKVAEVADTVNKKVGKGLASAIETGEKAAHSTKETLGAAKKKAGDAPKAAGQKANQAAEGAQEAKEDFMKEAKK